MITKKIKTALDEVGIPCYFITRGNNPAPCVVYNYNEKPKFFADNEEKAIQYTVLLNLYCNNNIENTKKLVYLLLAVIVILIVVILVLVLKKDNTSSDVSSIRVSECPSVL